MIAFKKYKFIKKWKKKNIQALQQMYPEIKKKDISRFLDDIIEKNLKNPNCDIDNDYINKNIKTTLLDVVDWIEDTDPICAGFGVFYKNQHEVYNPLLNMILKFLQSRKTFKSKLKYIVDKISYLYKMYDRKQLTEKVNCNSIYGALGNIISFLFNRYTAPSVTSTGQSLISTTEQAFEGFLSDNILFNNINECITYMNNILHEKYKMEDSFLIDVTPEQLVARIMANFYNLNNNDEETVIDFVNTLNQSQINRIYYKNNLYEFSQHQEVMSILINIVRYTDEFKDPNQVPKSTEKYLKKLWRYYETFVFYNYSPIDRIQRLRNDKRKTVITIDTDSNFLNLNPWVEFMKKNIIDNDYRLQSRDYNELKFISINTMAYIITQMIRDVLGKYTKGCNIPKEYRDYINIKNEFLMSRVVLAQKKKKYISSIRLREGDEIYPEKADIKGFEFMKSTSTEETKNKFLTILRDKILKPEVIDVAEILNDLEEFENEIIDSLKIGEKRFLALKSVKEFGAYEDPLRENGVRAIIAWNYIYPDNTIELPAKVDIVKLTLTTDKEFEKLKIHNPEIYSIVNEKILNNPEKRISSKGLPVIAIPKNIETIPEWLIEFIDIEQMSCDVMKKFYPLLNSLSLETISPSPSSKKEYFSNIINF